MRITIVEQLSELNEAKILRAISNFQRLSIKLCVMGPIVFKTNVMSIFSENGQCTP